MPDATDVKNAMREVSLIVGKIKARLTLLIEGYGIHGDRLTHGNSVFQLTRIAEEWGVWCHRPTESILITGCRMDEKLEFLDAAEELERLYRQRVAQIFSKAKEMIEKNTK